jgi:hypothetical protein
MLHVNFKGKNVWDSLILKTHISGLATARPMAGMYDKDGKSSKGYKA